MGFSIRHIVVFLLFVISNFSVKSQTTINFDDVAKWTAGSAIITSYAADHTYIDGVFSATGGPALRNTTAAQDGFAGALGTYSWRLQNIAGIDWRITIASGGVSTFSIDVRRWDASPTVNYALEFSTDGGTGWTTVATIDNTSLGNSSNWTTFNGTINSSNTNILIRVKANAAGERLMIDNFIWSPNSSPTPNLTVSTASLTGFTYIEGSGPSTSQSFDVTGANMDGTNVVVSAASTNYEVSTDNSSFSSSVTLTAYGGGATTIYVRLKSGLVAGDYNGEIISVTGGGDAAGETVSCDGTVTSVASGCATDLIISEYIEGGSSEKYIEIFNKTGSDVDLSDYELHFYANGAFTPTNTHSLSGTLTDGSAIVYRNSSATLYAATTSAAVNFNGDDAVALYKVSTTSFVDIFGCIGEDPGSAWTSASNSTLDKTLVRKPTVTAGVTTNPASGFPTLESEWDEYNIDDVSNLGSHTMNCGPCLAPTTEASALSFSSVGENSITVAWTNGDGSKRILVGRAGSAVTSNPVDGTTYTADAVFGNGDDIGTNEFVLYVGNGSTVNISGLNHSTTYYFKVFEYNCIPSAELYLTASPLNGSQATISCAEPTQATNITFPSVFSTSLTLNWTNGNGSGRIVIISDDASFTNPVDGTDPIANTIYAGSGDQVVYNGTGNSVTVTGLTASTQYWFRVYEYNCSGTNINFVTSTATNNPNSQTTTVAPVTTVLEPGDLAVLGLCSNTAACLGTSAGDDEISFVCFKDITTNTTFEMTDNGWERCNTGMWGNTEGVIRATRTGGTILAGTVITFRFYNGGTYTSISPDAGWNIVEIHGVGGTDLIMNSGGDQIFFMQGGIWDYGTNGNHDATLTNPNILFAFNARNIWSASCLTDPTKHSNPFPGLDCFSMMPGVASDYLKYTGPQTIATQIEWIGRINDNTNWTSFADCAAYYAASPNYETGHTIPISTVGVDVVYNWYGNRSTEWFDCANWGPLRVPTAANSVVIPNNINVSNDIVLIAGENAACLDFTINNPSYSIKGEGDATKVLTVNRDLNIEQGIIDFNDGNNATADGTIYVKRDWTNNGSTTDFDRGNSTVIFNGTGNQTIYSSDMVENFHNLTITSPAVLISNGSDLNISGFWNNYSASGFTEGTNLVKFDGTALQLINTAGGEVFYNMEIDNTSNLRLDNNLTVSNNLDLENGNILLNGKTLTLQSSLTRTNGMFSGTTTSILIINGSGALATSLMFDVGVENLGSLTINRTSSGTVTMGTNLNVHGLLSMAAGELIINDKILGLNGTVAGTGTLRGSVNSEISIGGTGVLGTLFFSTGSEELRHLTTNRTSGVSTIGTNLSVNNVLTLTNGKIATGTNRIYVTNSATNSIISHNENSYINGNLRRNVLSSGSYDFPVGTAAWYEIANINLVSSSGIGYIDAKFVNPHTGTSPTGLVIDGTPITTLLNSGFWTITPDAVTSADYDITLVSRGHTNGGTDPEQHTVLKRNDSSSPWVVDQGVHDNSTQLGSGSAPITAVRTDLSLFSDFAIARSSDFILPVELLSFKGYLLNSSIELVWETASELNNDYFTLEKSSNGIQFSELTVVPGKGTCSFVSFYSNIDENPYTGINYYRLKQTDFDGSFSYSPVIAVKANGENNEVQIIQNQNSLMITIPENNISKKISIHDVTGREIFTLAMPQGTNSLTINLKDIQTSAGIYFISISSSEDFTSKKIFIN
ncbi:MAG: lamin tail domain-containing protein [Bacteroidales bacterium]|nr:lamin tail domain-containing protein [Bacteroidales bacterium]